MSLYLPEGHTNFKVLFVIGTLNLGGAESQLLMLVRGLVERKIQCEVFALENMGELRKSFDELNVQVFGGQFNNVSGKITKALQLIQAIYFLYKKSRQVSVVHAFLPLTNFLGAFSGYFAGTDKIITSRRALGNHQDRWPWWKPLDKFANLISTFVVVNSQVVARDVIQRDGIDVRKLVCIYNGLNAESYSVGDSHRSTIREMFGFKECDIVVIIVANLIPYKGHRDLLEAFAKVYPLKPELRLMVVGEDRGIGNSLKSYAESLNLTSRIDWLGLRRDIAYLLSAADIYICASHEEGFSNSVLEALAAGKAVIATNVGGNSEALEAGRLGFLVEPHNSDSLAGAIKKLADNPELRNELGVLASVVVKNKYSPQKMVDGYLALYAKNM